jgi:hypothetical protein
MLAFVRSRPKLQVYTRCKIVGAATEGVPGEKLRLQLRRNRCFDHVTSYRLARDLIASVPPGSKITKVTMLELRVQMLTGSPGLGVPLDTVALCAEPDANTAIELYPSMVASRSTSGVGITGRWAGGFVVGATDQPTNQPTNQPTTQPAARGSGTCYDV